MQRFLVTAIIILGWIGTTHAEVRHARHVRLRTPHGPLHIWTPDNYDPATAQIVVYVHGFYVDVDEAWREHKLAAQFAQANLNALFIACESPSGPTDPIAWESLEPLLASVHRGLREDLPPGKLIVIGHSGGHRTIRSWFRAPIFDTLVLIDALYGEFPELRSWVLASHDHRLIDIGELTAPWADDFHAALPDTLVVDALPASAAAWQSTTGDAQIIYVRSHVGHMELVTSGKVLPTILPAPSIQRVVEAAGDLNE